MKKFKEIKQWFNKTKETQFRVLSEPTRDPVMKLIGLDTTYTLQIKNNLVWTDIKSGFTSYEDVIKYHNVYIEFMKDPKITYLPVIKEK